VQNDPRLHNLTWEIARAQALAGKWDDAWTTLASPPEDMSALNLYWVFRWRLLLWSLDVERTRAAIAELDAGVGFELREASRAICQIVVDRTVQPAIVADLVARGGDGRSQRRRAFFLQMKAEVLAAGGDHVGAIGAIEDAERVTCFDIGWIDGVPAFAPMRENPRFVAARAKIAARAIAVDAALSGRTPP
jgi:hypothetical protein